MSRRLRLALVTTLLHLFTDIGEHHTHTHTHARTHARTHTSARTQQRSKWYQSAGSSVQARRGLCKRDHISPSQACWSSPDGRARAKRSPLASGPARPDRMKVRPAPAPQRCRAHSGPGRALVDQRCCKAELFVRLVPMRCMAPRHTSSSCSADGPAAAAAMSSRRAALIQKKTACRPWAESAQPTHFSARVSVRLFSLLPG